MAAEIKSESLDSLKTRCLRLIQKRRRSTVEIKSFLQKAEVAPENIEVIVDFLVQHKLIDDLAFAKAWIHDRDLLAPRGEYLLKQELTAKGIDSDLIQQALLERADNIDNEVPTEDPEVTAGLALLKHKEALYSSLAKVTAQRRKTALLQRRGFSYNTIRRILNE